MPKIWAIKSGYDWYDASVDFLILPDGLVISEEKVKHARWYRDEFCGRDVGMRPAYVSFIDWLIERGATQPTEDQIEEYWEM